MPLEKHQKLILSMRYWLLGKEYYKALESLEFAKSVHVGTRKDGTTPEFDHQIKIAHFVRTLSGSLSDPEAAICVTFLHDIVEDYDIKIEEIYSSFGEKIGKSVELLTKEINGIRIPEDFYFEKIGNDSIASIVKGADRIHNFQSMPEVFSLEKQKKYIEECKKFILPMLKKARKKFPHQEECYENIKLMLESQIYLINKIHEAKI